MVRLDVQVSRVPGSNRSHLVARCRLAGNKNMISDGESGVGDEVTFVKAVPAGFAGGRISLALFVLGPEDRQPAEVECNIAERDVVIQVSGKPRPSQQPKIEGASPPLSSATNQSVLLTGQHLDELPPRILIGPFIARIAKINSTHAVARIPPSVTCASLQADGVRGTTPEDKVYGWQLVSDLNRSAAVKALCDGEDPNTMLSPTEFEWDPHFSSVRLAPALRLELALRTALADHSSARRSMQTATAVEAVIEAGGSPVDLVASFGVVDMNTGGEVDPAQLIDVRVATIASADARRLSQFNVSEYNLTSVIISTFANAAVRTSQPLHILRRFGPREYSFVASIPVFRPSAAVSIYQLSNRQVHLSLTIPKGTGRNIIVSMIAEAQVTARLTSTQSACSPAYPGLQCSFASMSESQSIVIDATLDVPEYYRRDITVRYAVTGSNLVSEVSGELVLTGTATGDPAASLGQEPTANGVLATEAPRTGDAERAVSPVFGFSSQRMACSNALMFTLLAWLGFVIMFAIIFKAVGARAPKTVDTHREVSLLRSLFLQHAWVSLFIPCHSDCAMAHVNLLFAHALALLATVAGLSTLIGNSMVNANWLIAGLAPILVQAFRPLLQHHFWAYRRNEKEFVDAMTNFRDTMKMRSMTKIKSALMMLKSEPGVSENALTALEDIELVEDEQAAQDAADNMAGVMAGGTLMALQNEVEVEFESEGESVDGTQGVFIPDNDTDSCVSVESSPELPTTVRIVVAPFAFRGHILVGFFCAIAVGLGYFLSSRFTTTLQCNFFTEVFVYALVVDLVVIQSFSVLLTYFYRWMVAEPDESLWAELHPVDGEERPA